MEWEYCEVGEECKWDELDVEFIKTKMWTMLIVGQEEIEGKMQIGGILTHWSHSSCNLGINFNEYMKPCDF